MGNGYGKVIEKVRLSKSTANTKKVGLIVEIRKKENDNYDL